MTQEGVSYPDITLIAAICENLKISEHELITSSEDYRQRELEKQAKSFRNIKRTYSWIWYIAYGAAIVACFICNLAVFHRLDWFFIVVASLMTAFSLINVPIIAKKHKGAWTLGSFYVSLIFLLAVCCIYTGGSWFFVASVSATFGLALIFLPIILAGADIPEPWSNHKTLISFAVDTILLAATEISVFAFSKPSMSYTNIFKINLVGVAVVWIIMLIIRYIPLNGFFRTAFCLFFSGVCTFVMNNLVNSIVYEKKFRLPAVNFNDWSGRFLNANITAIVCISMIGAGLLFAAGGIVCSLLRTNGKNS